MNAPDPWVVLGVDRSAGVEGARHAYLVRSQLLHPDRHQGAPPSVLAEAERAMRELNEAWESIRSGSPTATVAQEAAPLAPQDLAGCIAWILDRVGAAAERAGDPLTGDELALLESPAATAPRGRRFQRWLDHRRSTLRSAMTDTGTDTADWSRAWRIIAESHTPPVLLLLIDPA